MRRTTNRPRGTWLVAAVASVLAASSFATQTNTAKAGVVNVPTYTVCDFIDHRIDVDAQYALTILTRRSGSSRRTGLAIFTAVKTGRLEGIYQQNRGKPALLAQRHGSTWWTMLGTSKAKMLEWESPPMLVYKKSLGGAANRIALANALEAAWNADPVRVDRSKTPPPKGGSCSKPPPPPPPPKKKEKNKETKPDCPPGTIPGPHGDSCIVARGRGNSECTDAEMSSTFQRSQDFCAGIRTSLDLACNLGMNVCDVGGPPAKLACSTYEQIFGKAIPGTKPPECDMPRAQFYKQCTVSTVAGEASQMACFPGTASQIGRKYDRWPGRVR
ncbi:MAG: hypothetical protein ACRBN8_05235 [Nannocystales bacterium]